ncbi:MAG: type II toxin-antitoxin system VapC family toxin [Clostridiales bacterium]|nr:type II toxin-antitoxin system VapC family toxin [Clostridiales bacterium]
MTLEILPQTYRSVQEDGKLSEPARSVVERLDTPLFLSAVSAFEIANKHRLGKLPGYSYVVDNYHLIARKLEAAELPISAAHAHFAAKLDWGRQDPFDRILAAQAHLESLVLITPDSVFSSLPWISVLW